MAAEYNLLPADHRPNATFAVEFDVYNPRPHFIILPQRDVNVNPEFSQITNEQTQQLIKTGISVLECFASEIDRGILSIHRGSWKSPTRHQFHAHFCVEVDNYLRVFERRKEAIPDWPNERYVTSQWKYSRQLESYGENVRRYPHSSYLEREAEVIRGNLACEPDVQPEEVPLAGGITKIVYHPSHPKIGFVRTKPKTIEEFQQVLKAMEKFAQALGLTDLESTSERRGCHICLYLGSVPTDDWKFTSGDGEEVVGHVVMAAFRFYQLCPVDRRRDWFAAYQESDFKCAQT